MLKLTSNRRTKRGPRCVDNGYPRRLQVTRVYMLFVDSKKYEHAEIQAYGRSCSLPPSIPSINKPFPPTPPESE